MALGAPLIAYAFTNWRTKPFKVVGLFAIYLVATAVAFLAAAYAHGVDVARLLRLVP